MLHLVDLLKAASLGIVEGLTEFLPVSSTAHLILSSYIIDFKSVKDGIFEVIIQLGAILAVCVLYYKKIYEVVFNLNKKNNQKFALNLFLAFLPSLILGSLFHDFIKHSLFSNLVIAIALIVGGVIMIVIDHKPRESTISDVDNITPLKAFYIGLFQAISMVPGTSRSGATIIGGLLLGFSRKTAAEFSFFLAIPTIFAASVFDFFSNFHNITHTDVSLILVGLITSFLSAILVIKWFINFVSKNNFVPFGIYRIVVGILILCFAI